MLFQYFWIFYFRSKWFFFFNVKIGLSILIERFNFFYISWRNLQLSRVKFVQQSWCQIILCSAMLSNQQWHINQIRATSPPLSHLIGSWEINFTDPFCRLIPTFLRMLSLHLCWQSQFPALQSVHQRPLLHTDLTEPQIHAIEVYTNIMQNSYSDALNL